MNIELLKPANGEGYIGYTGMNGRQAYHDLDSTIANYGFLTEEIDADTLNELQIYSVSDYVVTGDTIGVVFELSGNGGEHYLIEGNNITIRRNGTQAIISGLGPNDIQTFRDYVNTGSVSGLNLVLNGIGEAGATIAFTGWDNNAADDWTNLDFIQSDIDNWNEAHGWGDHDGLYKLDFAENSAFNDDYGFSAGTVLEGNNKALIDVNTNKTSNVTHTGDVTGATVLTIGSNKVTSAHILTATITASDMGVNSVGASEITTNGVAKDELNSLSFTTTTTMSTSDYFLITPSNGVEEKITLANFKTNNLSEYWSTANFTATDVNEWNAAHDWGDHANENYLTSVSVGTGLDYVSNQVQLDFSEFGIDNTFSSTSYFVFEESGVEKRTLFSTLQGVFEDNMGLGINVQKTGVANVILNNDDLGGSPYIPIFRIGDNLNFTTLDGGRSVEISAIDSDTQLTESQVDAFVSDNGYLTSVAVGTGLDYISNQVQLDFSEFTIDNTLSSSSYFVFHESSTEKRIDYTTLKGLVDTDTQLSETQVDNFVANNGYLSSVSVGTGLDYISNQVQLDFSEFGIDNTYSSSSYFVFEESGVEKRTSYTSLKTELGGYYSDAITVRTPGVSSYELTNSSGVLDFEEDHFQLNTSFKRIELKQSIIDDINAGVKIAYQDVLNGADPDISGLDTNDEVHISVQSSGGGNSQLFLPNPSATYRGKKAYVTSYNTNGSVYQWSCLGGNSDIMYKGVTGSVQVNDNSPTVAICMKYAPASTIYYWQIFKSN